VRILHLLDWVYPCDHPFLTNVYAETLANQGHEMVWVMRPDGQVNEPAYHEWNGQSVYVLPTPTFDPVRSLLRETTVGIDDHPVASIVDDEGPFDIVQVRNDLAMGVVAARLQRELDFSFVHQITHLKAETEIEIAKKGLADRRVRRYLKGHAGRQLRRRISRVADLLFPISDPMKQYLQRHGVNSRMIPVYTGADTALSPDDFDGTTFREKYDVPDGPLLLYMGSMAPVRRLDFLFEVMHTLTDRMDIHLVMVGGRDEENRQRLEAAARGAGVRQNITFTGWISDSETLNSGIVATDLGLSPIPMGGILETNAPLKVLEYLNLETPVVATDTPDQRKVVVESGGGRAVPHDRDKFAEAIEDLVQEDNLNVMGRRGRKYVAENRSYEALAESVLDAYRQNLNI
jgi:glycosyltransferase involved in cell wall biosynthesis